MGQGGGIALVSRIGADACPLTINKQRSRFRKYFDPEEEGAFDSFGSAGGQYNPYQEKTGRDFDLFHLFSFFFFLVLKFLESNRVLTCQSSLIPSMELTK